VTKGKLAVTPKEKAAQVLRVLAVLEQRESKMRFAAAVAAVLTMRKGPFR